MRVFTIDDLRPGARATLEAMYGDDTARRTKCSKDDYLAGSVATLARFGHGEVFRADAWATAQSSPSPFFTVQSWWDEPSQDPAGAD